jgi:hypothetical protein
MMRRLLRWTCNTLAMASLLLCLATAGLWVRSYWVADRFVVKRREARTGGPASSPPHYELFVSSQLRGHLEGWVGWSECPEVGPTPPWEFEISHPQRFSDEWSDFTLRTDHRYYGGYAFTMENWRAPAVSLVAAFAVLPAIFAFRQIRAVRRRHHRSRLGLCPPADTTFGRRRSGARSVEDKVTRCRGDRVRRPGEGATANPHHLHPRPPAKTRVRESMACGAYPEAGADDSMERRSHPLESTRQPRE